MIRLLLALALTTLGITAPATATAHATTHATAPVHVTAHVTAAAGCGPGPAVITGVNAGDNWAPVTPSKWQFPGDQVILAQEGVSRPGPRRPFEYAVLNTGPAFGDLRIDADVRIDTPTSISNRDVIIVFDWRSDTEFSYVHLSQDNSIYPHNGIFVVDNADRLRIEDQWDGHHGAPPAITDTNWHHVTVTRCGTSVAVYMDNSPTPLMTATYSTFTSGRVGFGSFDNIGRMKDMTVSGTPTCFDRPATLVGTPGRDLLKGTRGPDVIVGLAGDDVIHGFAGDDVICGNEGNDVIIGGRGDDLLDGGPGHNVVVSS